MNKIEALEALQKEYHYSEILKQDEFLKQEDGTTVRNKIYDIADAFTIDMPVVTFQPDPSDPKGPMPNHTQDCLENKNYLKRTVCACWEISYTGIAVMDVVNRIAHLYNIQTKMFGRGSAQREKLEKLHKLLTNITKEPAITIDLSKPMISIPLED